jgi:hypothetical protein
MDMKRKFRLPIFGFYNLTILFLFLIIAVLAFFSLKNSSQVRAQSSLEDFGYNIHSLAKDSPENIRNIFSFLQENGHNQLRIWAGAEHGISTSDMQKLFDNAPSDFEFFVSLGDYNVIDPISNAYQRDQYREDIRQKVELFKDDERIKVWEILNEPHPLTPLAGEEFIQFTKDITSLIKSIDNNTLISPGALFWENEYMHPYLIRVLSETGITALDAHYYNTSAGSKEWAKFAQEMAYLYGLFFYIGEAGYKLDGPGHMNSGTSKACTNVASDEARTQRANQVFADINEFGSAGAFFVWQFSPGGPSVLICDPFSFFPDDPIFTLKLIDYIPGENAPIMMYECSVGGQIPPDGIFRPNPCENCTTDVEKPTRACAEQPTIFQTKEYRCNDIDPDCNGSRVALIDWDPVEFLLNTQKTKVPFVGYRDIIREDATSSATTRSRNPNDYINDYFDGVALWDDQEFDGTNPNHQRNLFWEIGVFRKLAPVELQDKYRIEMIDRGFDYEVSGYVWNYNQNGNRTGNSVLREKTMHDWAAQPQPFNGTTGRYPPDQNQPNYYDNYKRWSESVWGQLWHRIPMFSREDAPGKAILTIQHDPGKFNSSNFHTEEFPLAIPHVTRLYESTNALYELLTPTILQNSNQALGGPSQNLAQNPTKILAQASLVSDLQEPILLAQADIENPSCNGLELIIEPFGDSYGVKVWNTQPSGCGDYSDTANSTLVFYADGVEISRCNPSFFGTEYICRRDQDCGDRSVNGYSLGDNIGCQGRVPSQAQVGNRRLSVSFSISSGNLSGPASQGCFQNADCNCTFGDPSCSNLIPPEEVNICVNHSNINMFCFENQAREDDKPNDEICCSTDADIEVNNYREPVDEATYLRLCARGCIEWMTEADGITPILDGDDNPICLVWGTGGGSEDATMTRQIEVRLDIPYLKDVWQKTNGPNGIFNLFRPASMSELPDFDAKSKITYQINSPNDRTGLMLSGQTEIQKSVDGSLYFPYLGGIQQAKKCISEQILTPAELQSGIDECDFQ